MLELAEKDLRAAGVLADVDNPDIEMVGFHLQQAVEKALKAWLLLLDEEMPRTHDLSFLISRLETHGADVGQLWDFAELNPYAIQFRYGMPADDEPLDWPGFHDKARRLLARVGEMLDA